MTAAPAHEWFQVKGLIAAKPTTHVRYRGHTGKHMLVLSFTGFDPKADIGRLDTPQCSGEGRVPIGRLLPRIPHGAGASVGR
jgi:hypothetical protein